MEIRLRLLFDNTQTRTNMHTHSSRCGMAVKHTQAHGRWEGEANGTAEGRRKKVGESEMGERVGPRWDGGWGRGADGGGGGMGGLKESAVPFWNDQQMT